MALWGLVAARLLLPFSIESAFSLIPSPETVPSELLSYEGGQLAQPGRLDIVTNPAYSEAITIELIQTVDRVQQRTADFTVIWLAGAAIMGLYAVLSYWRLRRKVRTAVRMDGNVFQSEAVASPFVLGIIRPKIYLPFAMSEQNMTHVIAHERAHIRRGDHWWKPLGFVLLAVHWFNPVMWLAYILLCRDIELACDEKVIKALGTGQRADYSQALLSCAVHRRAIAACPLAFGEVGVKERVKSVLNYKKPAFWIVLAAVAACIGVAVCFLTDPPQEPESSHTATVPTSPSVRPTDGTAQLTLNDVLELSKKGTDLTWGDLAPYQCTDIGSGIWIFRYEIDNYYSLDVSSGDLEAGIDAAILRHHPTGNYIDIRTDDAQVFIRDAEPVDYLYYIIREDTLYFPLSSFLPQQGTVLHGSSSTGLSERFQAVENSGKVLPTQGTILLRFADEIPLRITWTTFDPYDTSTSGSIDDPAAINSIVLGSGSTAYLSSSLEELPPRRVQILCQYQDRTVEYLLIIAS